MALSFFSDMSDECLSTVFSYETAERLYKYITKLDYTLKIVDKRWQKVAILALCSKHETPEDIYYQIKFFQAHLFSRLKFSENEPRRFLLAVYNAMKSEWSTPEHKLYASFYLCKLNNMLNGQELSTAKNMLKFCIADKMESDLNVTLSSTTIPVKTPWSSWYTTRLKALLDCFSNQSIYDYDEIWSNDHKRDVFIASVPILSGEIIAQVYAANRWHYISDTDEVLITRKWEITKALAPRLNEEQAFELVAECKRMLWHSRVAKLAILKTVEILIANVHLSLRKKYARMFLSIDSSVFDRIIELDNCKTAEKIEYYELLYKIFMQLDDGFTYTSKMVNGFIRIMMNVPCMIKQPEHDDFVVLFMLLKRLVRQLKPNEFKESIEFARSTGQFLIFKELATRILNDEDRGVILRTCLDRLPQSHNTVNDEFAPLVFPVLASLAAQLTAKEVGMLYNSGILNESDKFPIETLTYLHALQLVGKLDDKAFDKPSNKTEPNMFYKPLDELDPEIVNVLRMLEKSRLYTIEQLEYKPEPFNFKG